MVEAATQSPLKKRGDYMVDDPQRALLMRELMNGINGGREPRN